MHTKPKNFADAVQKDWYYWEMRQDFIRIHNSLETGLPMKAVPPMPILIGQYTFDVAQRITLKVVCRFIGHARVQFKNCSGAVHCSRCGEYLGGYRRGAK